MHVLPYCKGRVRVTLAALVVLASALAAAQQTAGPANATEDVTFIVFMQGREIGRERASIGRTASGWTITSSGSLGAPIHLVNKRFQLTYAPDWQPIELKIEASVTDLRDPKAEPRAMSLATSFGTTTAINEITQNGVTTAKTDQITARSIVLPNNFFAGYEALAARLAAAAPGTEFSVYVAPQTEIKAVVGTVTPESYDTPSGPIAVRRFAVTFHNPGAPIEAGVMIDEKGRFARLDIPAAGLLVARQDLAGVSTRQQTFRNPTDADVNIAAAGFGLAGTITTPAGQGRLRHPAVVLLAGSGAADRDATVAGIPLFAQLAGQLAGREFVALRYDKRGTGQSGGRTERVTLQDYADDAVQAVRWLARRKDVDPDRLYLIGHSEGAAVAMLAAPQEKKIKGLVLMAGMGVPGRQLVLEQQQTLLAATSFTEEERAAKVALQTKILDAAIAQKDWEGIPDELRKAVDTPWYRSLLMFDPAKAMERTKQPILILQGELDTQVKPYQASLLAEAARARKNAGGVDLKPLPGLNHLFVTATTGQVSEYGSLASRTISPAVAAAIADWVASVPR